MRRVFIIMLLASALPGRSQVAPRQVVEGRIVYKLTSPNAPKEEAGILAGSTYTLSIKGSRIRTDFSGVLGNTVSIYSSQTHAGVLLQDYGQERVMVSMSKEDFEDEGKPYKNIAYTLTQDTMTVAGYVCRRAFWRDTTGDTLAVWYAPELVAQNKEYSFRFRELPGMPLAYESMMGNVKVLYTAVRVSLDPLPVAEFDVPKSGYRELTYAEARKLQ